MVWGIWMPRRAGGDLLEGDSFQPGNHSITWNGRDKTGRSMPSGVYFYALEAGAHQARHKMLLLK